MTDIREQVKAEAVEKLNSYGLDTPVRVLDVQMRELRDNGFLVDIDVTGVSPFYTSVDWHLDLGIPKSDERRTSGRLTPGRKCLVTDAGRFRSMETRARYNLEKHSHRVAVFGNYRYVPNTAFLTWLDKHNEIVAEWDEAKEALLDNYQDIILEVVDAFTAMARETWLTLVSRHDTASQEWIAGNSLDAFTEAVVQKAVSAMPSPEDIRDKLAIRLQPLATFLLSNEQAEIEREREQIMAEVEKSRLERDSFARSERAWVEREEAKTKAAKEEAYQRERAARAEADESIRRARIETEAIKSAQLEIARKAIKQMANPFEEVIGDLRTQVHSTVTEVLENIRQHGRVLGKTKEKIANLCDLFALLYNPAVTPDAGLEQAIGALRKSLSVEGDATKRDTAAIRSALMEVANIASQAAAEVAAETAPSKGAWEQLDL